MSANSAFQRPSGVIEHLIKLPEDDSARRFQLGLMISLGVNLAVCGIAYSVSNLHDRVSGSSSLTKPVDLTFDDLPKIVRQPEQLKPTPAPTPPPRKIAKVERAKPRPIHRTPRRIPTPPVRVAEVKPQPRPVVQPQPVPQPQPKVQPRNVAERRTEPTSTNNTAPVNPTSAVNPINTNASVNTTNTSVARVNTASANNLSTSAAVNTSVAANPASLARSSAFTGASRLASGDRTSISASREREGTTSIAEAAGGTNLPTGAPSATRGAAGVAARNTGAVGTRGGVNAVGVSTSPGAVNVAAISSPSFVGRHTPAMGSTVLVADRPTVLTSAMTDEGRANSGLATIQGSRGTIATSVAVGRTGVSGSSAGTASVGAGGRSFGTASDASGAAVRNASGTGAERGPSRGNSQIADLGTKSVASSAGEGRRGDGVARAGDDVAGAAGNATRSSGGSGPTGATGTARVSGAGGTGAATGAGSAGNIGVETKTNAGGDDLKNKPSTDNKVARTGDPGGKAGTRNEDAEQISAPNVQLSDTMKKRQFKGRVLVQVTVEANGDHDETLLQGSGDDEIDALVLRTLNRWKWRPAYRDGEKVKSTKKFTYNIRVED